MFVWYANGNYMALEYTKYHDFSYVQTLVTKIRSVEDYSQDKPVIVVGSPKDYVGSVAYGMLTYIRSGVQKEDMEVRLLCTDVSTGDGASGFVLKYQ